MSITQNLIDVRRNMRITRAATMHIGGLVLTSSTSDFSSKETPKDRLEHEEDRRQGRSRKCRLPKELKGSLRTSTPLRSSATLVANGRIVVASRRGSTP